MDDEPEYRLEDDPDNIPNEFIGVPARTVHGREPLPAQTRLGAYCGVAAVWLVVYGLYPLVSELLTDSSGRLTIPLFVAIIVAYQYFLELSLRRWPSQGASVALALLMPILGATGFLLTLMVGSNPIRIGRDICDMLLLMFIGVPIYYIVTAPVTIPLALGTMWVVRRVAPIPPPKPEEDFDLY